MKKPEFKKGKKLAAILQKMYFPKGKELFFDGQDASQTGGKIFAV